MAKQKTNHLKARRPSRAKEAAITPTRIGLEGSKRLGADVPVSVYVQVEERCKERGITKRDYLLELLSRDGIE